MNRRRTTTLVFGLALATSLGLLPIAARAQQTDRAKAIGGKFMCMCGCNQVLTQCNHVGCSTSASMLKEIDMALGRGDSEDTITQALVQEFGTKVYAEPPKSGFSLIAWLMPSFYLVVGAALVIFLILRWRARVPHQLASPGVPSGISPEDLERARRRVTRDTED